MSKFTPSKEQKEIFKFILNGEKNAVISAVAGSGKTTTLLEALKLIPEDKSVLFMAFNKSIAKELRERVPQRESIKVMTVHGFGIGVTACKYRIAKFESHACHGRPLVLCCLRPRPLRVSPPRRGALQWVILAPSTFHKSRSQGLVACDKSCERQPAPSPQTLVPIPCFHIAQASPQHRCWGASRRSPSQGGLHC